MKRLLRGPLRALLFSSLLSALGCSYAMEEIGLFKTADIRIPPWGQTLPLGESLQDKLIDFELLKITALKNCLECHTSGNRSMDSIEKVLRLQNEITFVIEGGTMPPKSSGLPSLTVCEKKILEAWLDNQNQKRAEVLRVRDLDACRSTEAKPPSTAPTPEENLIPLNELEPTFEAVKERILAPKCLTCHAPGDLKRPPIDTIEALEKNSFISSKAENSVLYQIVVPDMYFMFMPPKKSGQPPLSTEEVEFIKRWIDSRSEPAEMATAL